MADVEMVERAARAIYYYDSTSERPDWTREPVVVRARYRCLARAAIEALREPTEAVLDAVQTEIDIWPDDRPKPSPNAVEFVSRDEADSIWRAGIDAILKEE